MNMRQLWFDSKMMSDLRNRPPESADHSMAPADANALFVSSAGRY